VPNFPDPAHLKNRETIGEDEHFEHLPWEHLSASGPDRRWWAYAVAGALLVAALTAVLVRSSPSVAMSAVATTLAAPTAEATPSTSVALAATATSATTAAVYSEADLMALAPAGLLAEAGAMAEWFATEFFSLSGSSSDGEVVRSMLPADSPVPPGEGRRSFVEWASAVEVEEVESGRYRVLVVFRTLGATGTDEYRRLPPRAVWIDLRWTPEGWALLDLPAPAGPPAWSQMPAWPAGEVPDAVQEMAAAQGGVVIGGGQVGGIWRVVVEATDDAGGRWPLVMWFDDRGTVVEAPPTNPAGS
jgi:hypothetical protein